MRFASMKQSNNFLLLFLSCFFFNARGQTDTAQLRQHVLEILNTKDFRHFMNTPALNDVAEYIFKEFRQGADSVYFQTFQLNGQTYRNVVAVYNGTSEETIVIGAHYDVCGMQNGADDNASGVAGMLEIARQIKEKPLSHRIELVAYTLEEPPFFRTDHMGSYVHAKSLADAGRSVYGMISLEMIGYFSDAKQSQDYPLGILKLIYGNKGNFITLVNKFGKGKFAGQFTREFKRTAAIRTKRFTGPKLLPGVDFSDHLNYWTFGYSALMITDTAFYRNKNYHMASDTIDTLDFKRMAMVIDDVIRVLL
jgi:Zn-dependent M28 family amino/carboxypeptidase